MRKPADTSFVTQDAIKEAFASKDVVVTPGAVMALNDSLEDPEFQGVSLLSSAVSLESVMRKQRGGCSVEKYLNALKFCAYLSTNGDIAIEAYKRVFRYRDSVIAHRDAKSTEAGYRTLASAATVYRASPLVTDILIMARAPIDIMYLGARYKAIGVLSDLTMSAKLDRDKINAAKELLIATKGVEVQKIELEVGVVESSAVNQMQEQLAKFAALSVKELERGSTGLKELGAMKVVEDAIEGEVIG